MGSEAGWSGLWSGLMILAGILAIATGRSCVSTPARPDTACA
jgi:hypothetical protein